MFIHLGGEKVIRTSELVAILDISIHASEKNMEPFIPEGGQVKKVEVIGEEDPKSVVVTLDKIYYSPISSMTLKKRANSLITS